MNIMDVSDDDISVETKEERVEYPTEYLGDGVYASFDGYGVWLRVGSHLSEPVVALEPSVMRALFSYEKRLYARFGRELPE